jgi:hypothetical protein
LEKSNALPAKLEFDEIRRISRGVDNGYLSNRSGPKSTFKPSLQMTENSGFATN